MRESRMLKRKERRLQSGRWCHSGGGHCVKSSAAWLTVVQMAVAVAVAVLRRLRLLRLRRRLRLLLHLLHLLQEVHRNQRQR